MIIDQPESTAHKPKPFFRDPLIILIIISFGATLVSYGFMQFDSGSGISFLIFFLSFLSSLILVGYVSTPSGSWQGKLAFAGVCVMVAGISMKVLHLPAAQELIILGLVIIGLAYILLWVIKK